MSSTAALTAGQASKAVIPVVLGNTREALSPPQTTLRISTSQYYWTAHLPMSLIWQLVIFCLVYQISRSLEGSILWSINPCYLLHKHSYCNWNKHNQHVEKRNWLHLQAWLNPSKSFILPANEDMPTQGERFYALTLNRSREAEGRTDSLSGGEVILLSVSLNLPTHTPTLLQLYLSKAYGFNSY